MVDAIYVTGFLYFFLFNMDTVSSFVLNMLNMLFISFNPLNMPLYSLIPSKLPRRQDTRIHKGKFVAINTTNNNNVIASSSGLFSLKIA